MPVSPDSSSQLPRPPAAPTQPSAAATLAGAADMAGAQAAAGAAGPQDGAARVQERGGPGGLEPTRYGDWERAGRCIDF